MSKGYVSVKVYRRVLIFAASASFLCGIVLMVAGHPWGGSLALAGSIAASVLLFISGIGFNNRKIDEELAEDDRERARRKHPDKPTQPQNYKDLN